MFNIPTILYYIKHNKYINYFLNKFQFLNIFNLLKNIIYRHIFNEYCYTGTYEL